MTDLRKLRFPVVDTIPAPVYDTESLERTVGDRLAFFALRYPTVRFNSETYYNRNSHLEIKYD